ncbi:MAG: 23S rRNA (uracil1939-C5)-methyltransferase [Arenicella sp.]|jgi:23S rRNA (uracil1939-C5)-methyltransferase
MARKRTNIQIENLVIEDIADKGRSLAKKDGQVIFVKNTVPGDIVDVQVVKKKKSFMEAIPTKFIKKSEDRIEAFCEYFGTCGGCKWQNLTYEKQLFYKQKQVNDSLTRIGKLELPEIKPIIGSAETKFYRNKLEFTFTHGKWLTREEIDNHDVTDRRGLGFHIPGRFDKVLDIDQCHLQEEPSNSIRLAVRDFAKEHEFSFFNVYEMKGFMRNLAIRTTSTGEVMVNLIVGDDNMEGIQAIMEFLQEKFPEITSLNYTINQKMNDTYGDLEVVNFSGKPYIEEEMEGLRFRIGPKSFYQTNSHQAYELYKVARNLAQLTGDEVVYDLYTGTGTIAQFVAKQAKEVIGIEFVEDAIKDAKINAQVNNITNTKFYAGDMHKMLTPDFMRTHSKPDVIITDPPRSGMHPKVLKMLLEIAAPRIVYVSCNPATQARDLEELDRKYVVKEIQPVDMFPHTHHVENVVLLELRKS